MMRIYLSFRHENDDQAEGERVSSGDRSEPVEPDAPGAPDDPHPTLTASSASIPGGGGAKAAAG